MSELFDIILGPDTGELEEPAAVIVADGILEGFGRWVLDEAGLLFIDGKGKMPDWDYWCGKPTPWADLRDQIKTVSISDNITSIGESAFIHCVNLVKVTIPDSVTSIENHAFGGCINLPEIIIPNTVKVIARYAFQNCPKLCNVTAPYQFRLLIPTSYVIASGRIGWDGEWTFDEDGLLYIDCNGNMPHWESSMPTLWPSSGSSWPSWRDYANHCKAIYLSDRVTNIDNYAFAGFLKLTTIRLPVSITSIEDCAFRDCKSLTKIIIPNRVKKIGSYAFSGCKNLTEIHIPQSVTTIESLAFSGCKKVRKVTMPSRFDCLLFKYKYDISKSVVTFI